MDDVVIHVVSYEYNTVLSADNDEISEMNLEDDYEIFPRKQKPRQAIDFHFL